MEAIATKYFESLDFDKRVQEYDTFIKSKKDQDMLFMMGMDIFNNDLIKLENENKPLFDVTLSNLTIYLTKNYTSYANFLISAMSKNNLKILETLSHENIKNVFNNTQYGIQIIYKLLQLGIIDFFDLPHSVLESAKYDHGSKKISKKTEGKSKASKPSKKMICCENCGDDLEMCECPECECPECEAGICENCGCYEYDCTCDDDCCSEKSYDDEEECEPKKTSKKLVEKQEIGSSSVNPTAIFNNLKFVEYMANTRDKLYSLAITLFTSDYLKNLIDRQNDSKIKKIMRLHKSCSFFANYEDIICGLDDVRLEKYMCCLKSINVEYEEEYDSEDEVIAILNRKIEISNYFETKLLIRENLSDQFATYLANNVKLNFKLIDNASKYDIKTVCENIVRLVEFVPEHGINALKRLLKFVKIENAKTIKASDKKSLKTDVNNSLVKIGKTKKSYEENEENEKLEKSKSTEKITKKSYFKSKMKTQDSPTMLDVVKSALADTNAGKADTGYYKDILVKIFLLCSDIITKKNLIGSDDINMLLSYLSIEDYPKLKVPFLNTYKKWDILTEQQCYALLDKNISLLNECHIPTKIRKNYIVQSDPNNIINFVFGTIKDHPTTLSKVEIKQIITKIDEKTLFLFSKEEIKVNSNDFADVLQTIIEIRPEIYDMLIKSKIDSAEKKLSDLIEQSKDKNKTIDQKINFVTSENAKADSFTCGLCTINPASHIFEKCFHSICIECCSKVHGTCPYCRTPSKTKAVFFG